MKRLDTKSRDALDTLQKEFPYGVRRADGTLRLYWCTEKPHSMVMPRQYLDPNCYHLVL